MPSQVRSSDRFQNFNLIHVNAKVTITQVVMMVVVVFKALGITFRYGQRFSRGFIRLLFTVTDSFYFDGSLSSRKFHSGSVSGFCIAPEFLHVYPTRFFRFDKKTHNLNFPIREKFVIVFFVLCPGNIFNDGR